MSSSRGDSSHVGFVSAGNALQKDEIERFSRQIMVEGIGVEGMRRIRAGTVCCVGAGGLGSTIALYLCAAGVGTLLLVDFDDVEVSNLHRQVIHTAARVHENKATSARTSCLAIFPAARVEAIPEVLSVGNAERILSRCDVVVDGTDNVAARYLINDVAVKLKKPLVSGSALRWEGQLSVYGLHGGPCYRCLFPQPPPPAAVGSCNDSGVMGPVPGMIGCLQALEALKVLAGVGEPLSGRMLLFDGLRLTMRVVKLRPRQAKTCPACGDDVFLESEGGTARTALPSFAELAKQRPEYVPVDTCGTALHSSSLPASARCTPLTFARHCVYPKASEPLEVPRLPRRRLSQDDDATTAAAALGASPSRVWPLCVDVRAPAQFDMCHLPHSHSLPLADLLEWAAAGSLKERWRVFLTRSLQEDTRALGKGEALSSLEGVTVYLICRRGIASVQATQLFLSSLTDADGNSSVLSTADTARTLFVSFVNVDGGLNAYHRQVDKSFPFY